MTVKRRPWTIIDAIRDGRLFGQLPAFRNLATWARWLVFLKAIYGLPLNAEECRLFCHHTGRSGYAPRRGGFLEAVMIVGRQSGKTQIASTLAAYEAIRTTHEPNHATLYAVLIAQDHRAALRTIFSYAVAPFETSAILAAMVSSRTTDTLVLRSGIVLTAYPSRPSAVRGLRAQIVICDELAFYRSAEGNPQDLEMLRAVRPTLATTGGRLIILSSPYAQSGALWDLYRTHFARDDSTTLLWKATAPEMNPTLPADYLERMAQDDPDGYRSEVLGEFRAGLSLLFAPDALDACRIPHRRELLPRPGLNYRAFCDPSGGRRDAFTLAVGHKGGQRVVVDVVRAWEAPFNPTGVVAEAVTLLRRYRVTRLAGDRFGGEWPREAFRAHGITYDVTDLDRSGLYLELLPVVNAGAVEFPDLPDLFQELRGLERRRGPSGRDRVVPGPHLHDDRANVVAGLVHLLARRRHPMFAALAETTATHTVQAPSRWRCPNKCGFETLNLGGDRELRCPRCDPGWKWQDIQRSLCSGGLRPWS